MTEFLARCAKPTTEQKHSRTGLSGEAGIWIFVAGDLIVFTLFFVLVALGYRNQSGIFFESAATLNVTTGVTNTILLLTGSWFVATGIERMKNGPDPRTARHFSLATLCGVAFIVNKYFEWRRELSQGMTPATNEFYMYYFVFLGIHLFHVILGVAALQFARHVSLRPKISLLERRSVESAAIFWHLVDLLWVILFALFYLF